MLSPKILAVLFIAVGIALIFALSGFQITKLFSPGITEDGCKRQAGWMMHCGGIR